MKTAIALGTFDGIHIAHREVLALPDGYKKTVVTFLKPPKMVLENSDELIMDYADRAEIFTKLGFEEIVALDFSKVKDMSPDDFFNFLKENYSPSLICCGYNYRFGKDGKGDTALLYDFCKKNGIECKISDAVTDNGEPISSTLIRKMLKNGDITGANKLLFEPFSFTAKVEHGEKRGRTIGFPTINQYYPENLVKVKFGVYKTVVTVDGKVYEGVTDIGIRPTFKSERIISETYIKNFSGDLYGKTVKISLKEFLRSEKKFASLDELKKQIEIDKLK